MHKNSSPVTALCILSGILAYAVQPGQDQTLTVSATLLNWETQTLQVQAHADRPTVVGLALKHRSPHRPES